MDAVAPDWFDGFFEGEWLDYLAVRPPEQTDREAGLIVEALGLQPGMAVLDLACGRGRISVELARRGMQVTGLDLSPGSLELAASAAEEAGVQLVLIHRDMRQLDEVERYDAVVSMFSSFGYFERQEDDERVLANVARALVPGGGLLLDTINPVGLSHRFAPRDWRRFDDGTTLLEEREHDQLAGRVRSEWTFVHRDGDRRTLSFSMRMYTAAELAAMFAAAGLPVERSWGGFGGEKLGEGTRAILLGRRPS
jgi:2-polyprenyl-3-methyl-5-hydroxy-6-metoxy-1,4-benzoquinol methylase